MNIQKNSTKLICILAAGIGSRMGEYTEIINKSLLPINFTSSLTKIINSFPKSSRFVIASGFKKENVKNFVKILNNKNIKVVNVKKFTGKGSGPALSLYSCKKYLQNSFYFIPCDTFVAGDFLKHEDNNWLGIGKFKRDYKDYCNFVTNKKFEIEKIYDKKKPKTNNFHNFVGLGFIKDFKLFWKCFNKNLIIKNYELSIVFNKFLKLKKIKTKKITWEDIGTIEKYKEIKKKYEKYDFSKTNEIIYFEKNKVIKFHTSKKDLKNKYKKYLYNRHVFPKVKMNKDFLFYDFIKAKSFYDVASPELFQEFLKWCTVRLWKKSKEDKNFKVKCKNFYFHKTKKRVRKFFKNNEIKTDIFNRVNNQKVPKIQTLLKKIDFGSLYEGKNVFIHGDLQFDNILVLSKKNFKLIDWRPDFDGSINMGDLYYDLSKLYGGILINYKQIKKNKFSYSKKNSNIKFKLPSSRKKDLLLNELRKYCLSNKLNFSKIKTLVALIYLNMSPMHKHPFDKILFCYAKILMKKQIYEN
ncbi:MAG: hypothetical protein CBD95_006025 [Flavobacteriales bacterium TMED235]|nr:MAG: hypothetical protein CBD95_006025 [Flavobacteriales bacterium TMED235]